MDKRYAIITFRDSGPLKSWATIRGAQVHNSREKPIAHAEVPIPPKHVIGSGDLVQDIKTALHRHGIDPARLRKNGVIAYEAVLTASPAFFDDVAPRERGSHFSCWFDAQRNFLLAKYGAHRLVSLVLHLDEKTPHLHAVILPLHRRADGRSKNPAERWALVGRIISGPGQFDRLQDEYAKAMEPLGLCRGEVKSGRKHKPVREYLADLKAQEAANAKRSADLEAGLARLRDQALRTEVDRRTAQREKQAVVASRAACEQARAKIEAERGVLEADRRLLDDLFGALETSRQKAARFMQMVQRFPESRWSEETLVMAKAASAAAGPSREAMDLLRAEMARPQSHGR